MATGFPARVVALVAICAASVAHAERRPVAVVSLSEDSDASRLADELYDTLVNHPDLRPLLPQPALQGKFLDEDGDALRNARQARADADAALGLAQPDYAKAEREATRGTNELAQASPTADMLQIYADLMFDLGYAQLGLGKPIDASRSFALVRRLDPTRRPDPARYLPEVVEAYDATAKLAVSRSPLTVKGHGVVWIDGKQLGDAPQTQQLADGLHFVQLTGPDREARGEQVTVPQATEVNVADAFATEELKIRRARLELFHATNPMTRASAVKRIAQLLGVNDAVIISKSLGGVLLVQTWQDRAPGFSAIREHGGENPNELLAPLAPPHKVEPPKEIVPPLPPITAPLVVEKPWYRKRWVQASAATGVLAIIASAVLLARHDQMVTLTHDTKWQESPQ